MCLLDFITRQDDRHLSNMAILFTESGTKFYPLYDNGRSLFFEDREETVAACIKDIPTHATSFGEIGTYLNVMKTIAKDHEISSLINLNVPEDDIYNALKNSRFTGYRLDGAFKWIVGTLEILRMVCVRHAANKNGRCG
jgi:hypothetical protein